MELFEHLTFELVGMCPLKLAIICEELMAWPTFLWCITHSAVTYHDCFQGNIGQFGAACQLHCSVKWRQLYISQLSWFYPKASGQVIVILNSTLWHILCHLHPSWLCSLSAADQLVNYCKNIKVISARFTLILTTTVFTFQHLNPAYYCVVFLTSCVGWHSHICTSRSKWTAACQTRMLMWLVVPKMVIFTSGILLMQKLFLVSEHIHQW